MVAEFPKSLWQLSSWYSRRGATLVQNWRLLALTLALTFVLPISGQAATSANTQQEHPGAVRFRNDCAACHGSAGDGQGPVAGALSTPPSDLTGLARRNAGEFPTEYVRTVIDGRSFEALAHGNLEMPVWGNEYRRSLSGLGEAKVQRRIKELVDYLRTIQRP